MVSSGAATSSTFSLSDADAKEDRLGGIEEEQESSSEESRPRSIFSVEGDQEDRANEAKKSWKMENLKITQENFSVDR